MAPQPLSTFRNNGGPLELGPDPDALQARPKLAPLIAIVISRWSYIDSSVAGMVCSFMKGDFKTVVAMLNAVTSSEARQAATVAAAQSALPERDYLLFKAVMNVIAPSRRRRNEFAHHLWAIPSDMPDALCLIDPAHLGKWYATLREPTTTRGETPLDRSKVYVYREADLREAGTHAIRAHKLVQTLESLFGTHNFTIDPTEGERVRQRLSNQPEVQRALERLSKKRTR